MTSDPYREELLRAAAKRPKVRGGGAGKVAPRGTGCQRKRLQGGGAGTAATRGSSLREKRPRTWRSTEVFPSGLPMPTISRSMTCVQLSNISQKKRRQSEVEAGSQRPEHRHAHTVAGRLHPGGSASATGSHRSTTVLISPSWTPSYVPVTQVQRVSPRGLVRLSRAVNGRSAVILRPSILTAHAWLGGTSSSTVTVWPTVSSRLVPSEKLTVCSLVKSTVPGPSRGTLAFMVDTEPLRVSRPMSQVLWVLLVFSSDTRFSTLLHSRLVTLAHCNASGGWWKSSILSTAYSTWEMCWLYTSRKKASCWLTTLPRPYLFFPTKMSTPGQVRTACGGTDPYESSFHSRNSKWSTLTRTWNLEEVYSWSAWGASGTSDPSPISLGVAALGLSREGTTSSSSGFSKRSGSPEKQRAGQGLASATASQRSTTARNSPICTPSYVPEMELGGTVISTATEWLRASVTEVPRENWSVFSPPSSRPPEPSRGILAVMLPVTPSMVLRSMFQVVSTSVILEMVTVLITVWHSLLVTPEMRMVSGGYWKICASSRAYSTWEMCWLYASRLMLSTWYFLYQYSSPSQGRKKASCRLTTLPRPYLFFPTKMSTPEQVRTECWGAEPYEPSFHSRNSKLSLLTRTWKSAVTQAGSAERKPLALSDIRKRNYYCGKEGESEKEEDEEEEEEAEEQVLVAIYPPLPLALPPPPTPPPQDHCSDRTESDIYPPTFLTEPEGPVSSSPPFPPPPTLAPPLPPPRRRTQRPRGFCPSCTRQVLPFYLQHPQHLCNGARSSVRYHSVQRDELEPPFHLDAFHHKLGFLSSGSPTHSLPHSFSTDV
ncbi:hypothetical protein CRUP_001665 [Coryphaenoides rupestris]|nr:hypothetical protein CRUP_001665 [Coryphaenoides rupestris]